MILAARSIVQTEAELAQRVRREEGGTYIEELERLARTFGLAASVQEANAQQIRALLDAGSDVIAYVNRSVFDLPSLSHLGPALRTLQVHAVVPVRVTTRHVTFHDPRLPAILSKTIQRFEAAQRHMRSTCLVVSAPTME
jgi:hypothetical protein